MVGDAAVVVVVLSGIDGATFLPAEEIGEEWVLLRLHYYDLAGLPRG